MPDQPPPPRPGGAEAPGPDIRCPACGGAALVAGTFDGRGPNAFHPDGLRFWTLGPVAAPVDRRRAPASDGIAGPFASRAQACTTCGLAWVHVDPRHLRAVIDAAGKPATREKLASAQES